MIFVVIPYKLDNGKQLKLTLRSIAKYYPTCEPLLTGDCPDWYAGTTIGRVDKGSYPAQLDSTMNILNAMIALDESNQRKAIIAADDIIALQQLEDADFVDTYEATLDEMSIRKPQNKHVYDNTRRILQERNASTYAYTLHRPYTVDVAQYIDITRRLTIPELKKGRAVASHSVYSNLTHSMHYRGTDYKIYSKTDPLRTSDFVSTLYSEGVAFEELKKKFNRKSRWEK